MKGKMPKTVKIEHANDKRIVLDAVVNKERRFYVPKNVWNKLAVGERVRVTIDKIEKETE